MRMRERCAGAAAAAWAILGASCASFAPELGPLQEPFVDAARTEGGQATSDDGGGGAQGDGGADATTAGDAAPPFDAMTPGDAITPDDATAAPDVTATDATSSVEAGPRTWTVLVAPNGAHVFSPSSLTAHAGDTVQWVWQGGGHTVTSGAPGVADGAFCSPFDTGCGTTPTSAAGTTYQHAFAAPGTYPYFCRIHFQSGMTGTVVVQ
jgi:plastocyanin